MLLTLFFIFAFVLTFIIQQGREASLKVVFIDVGQGDSILISQGSQQLLIDGGRDGKLLLEKLGRHVPFWDRNIETIIETHPDADHIGGLIDVLKAYKVDSVLKTNMLSDSQTFKKLEDLIESRGIEKIEAKKDVNVRFSGGALASVLFPFETVMDINSKDTNMYSVVVKLIIGESEFLFTGDLPIEQEKEIISKKIDIKSDMLKIGHHGSRYSTSEEFLDIVKPTDAIIPVGKNNSYGHPTQEVLQRLLSRRINIFRTDESGDIVYECNKSNFDCQRTSR